MRSGHSSVLFSQQRGASTLKSPCPPDRHFLSGPVELEIDEDLGSRHYANSAAGPSGTTGTDDDDYPSDDSGSFNLARA